MKSQTTRGAFSPLMLIIETPFEFDSIMLALRIGADGMRNIARTEASQKGCAIVNDDAAACAEYARECLNNPEVTR